MTSSSKPDDDEAPNNALNLTAQEHRSLVLAALRSSVAGEGNR
jgi:hypothetical protein